MKKILVLGLSLLMAVSMAACGKEEEPEVIPEHNYAQNEVVEKTEEEEVPEEPAEMGWPEPHRQGLWSHSGHQF